MGDFNIPTIDWTALTHCTDYVSALFTRFVRIGGFTQFVNFHTRGNNLLDLVLSNDSKIVCSITSKPPLGHSDHNIIDFKLDVKTGNIGDHDKENTAESHNIIGIRPILMDYRTHCPRLTGTHLYASMPMPYLFGLLLLTLCGILLMSLYLSLIHI